ncbi:DUF2244 domain-containing protein [Kaistia geumhonensis]|uniref:Membrane protein n=1 Tax=Kaistia geumhonensis TaxID=410839 RepID=A0ABU0M6R7_9HYPH|nr:DUF2244 domain-containing protein [Kaistia geumhonensis]MCX5478273.1 DUF2244 domain-containing protein [Kaistia geumhonensis]MDQ0516510.1 putative membrane protein [Kaistia geumhonensis]
MTDRNMDEPAELVFSAVLKPYRSLSPRGFALLLMLVASTCFASGLLFWSLGAWPIAGFFGLDILAIQFAFRLNYRAARAREIVEMTRDTLTIRRISASGKTEQFDFNPYWARLEVERLPDWGITRMALASHGKRLAIGSFLNPDDREGFATALQSALTSLRSR